MKIEHIISSLSKADSSTKTAPVSLTCGHKHQVFPRVNSVTVTVCALHPCYRDAQQPSPHLCQHFCQHFLYKLIFLSWLTKCQMHELLPLSWTERCEKQCFSAPSNCREVLAEFQKSRSDTKVHVTEGILECMTSELSFFHTGKAEFENLDVSLQTHGHELGHTENKATIVAHHRHGICCFCGLIIHCTNLISCCFNCRKMCSSRHNLFLFLPTEWPELRAPLLVPSSQQDGSEWGGCCSLAVSSSCTWDWKNISWFSGKCVPIPSHPISWLDVMVPGLVSSLHLPLSCVYFPHQLNVTSSSFNGFMELFGLLSDLHSPSHLSKSGFRFCQILLLCNITANSWVWCWMGLIAKA